MIVKPVSVPALAHETTALLADLAIAITFVGDAGAVVSTTIGDSGEVPAGLVSLAALSDL